MGPKRIQDIVVKLSKIDRNVQMKIDLTEIMGSYVKMKKHTIRRTWRRASRVFDCRTGSRRSTCRVPQKFRSTTEFTFLTVRGALVVSPLGEQTFHFSGRVRRTIRSGTRSPLTTAFSGTTSEHPRLR